MECKVCGGYSNSSVNLPFKGSLDGKIVFGKITHRLDVEIRNVLKTCLGMGIPCSIHSLVAIENEILFPDRLTY